MEWADGSGMGKKLLLVVILMRENGEEKALHPTELDHEVLVAIFFADIVYIKYIDRQRHI